MSTALKFGAPAVFMIVVLASGIAHGMKTFRWSEKPSLDAYLARLDAIPKNIGNWTGEDSRYDDDLRAHGIEKYIRRTYSNLRTTEKYEVLVVCGLPGPIAAHTPDVCYRGSGYTASSDPKRLDFTVTSDDNPARGKAFELYFLKFRPPPTRLTDHELDIRWGWLTPDGKLRAPTAPRIEFSPQPALYKVYVIHERPAVAADVQPSTATSTAPLPQAATQNAHDPKMFLEAFLPRLEEALAKDVAPDNAAK